MKIRLLAGDRFNIDAGGERLRVRVYDSEIFSVRARGGFYDPGVVVVNYRNPSRVSPILTPVYMGGMARELQKETIAIAQAVAWKLIWDGTPELSADWKAKVWLFDKGDRVTFRVPINGYFETLAARRLSQGRLFFEQCGVGFTLVEHGRGYVAKTNSPWYVFRKQQEKLEKSCVSNDRQRLANCIRAARYILQSRFIKYNKPVIKIEEDELV